MVITVELTGSEVRLDEGVPDALLEALLTLENTYESLRGWGREAELWTVRMDGRRVHFTPVPPSVWGRLNAEIPSAALMRFATQLLPTLAVPEPLPAYEPSAAKPIAVVFMAEAYGVAADKLSDADREAVNRGEPNFQDHPFREALRLVVCFDVMFQQYQVTRLHGGDSAWVSYDHGDEHYCQGREPHCVAWLALAARLGLLDSLAGATGAGGG